jgi:hypothetical protein
LYIVGDTLNKLGNQPVKEKQRILDANRQLKKEFLLVYNAYRAFANACEHTFRTEKAYSATRTEPVKLRAKRKHLQRAILSAESWDDRDVLFRRLAAQCYRDAQWFKKQGDHKNAHKWMNLTLRFLRLSLDPKAKQQMEQVLSELAELKNVMKEREEKQEPDGEDDQES